MAHQTSEEHPSAYATLARLQTEAPALPEALASAAAQDAAHRRDIVNSFNLGDQTVLQSLEVVVPDERAGRLDLTDFGHEVIDAAAIVANDDLTAEQHARLEADAQREYEETAVRDESIASRD